MVLPRPNDFNKMFDYWAIIAEVWPGIQTVFVMGSCNQLNNLLTVFTGVLLIIKFDQCTVDNILKSVLGGTLCFAQSAGKNL